MFPMIQWACSSTPALSKSTYNTEANRTVRAVIGAMGVDIDKNTLLESADKKGKARDDAKKKDPNDWRATNAAGDQAECALGL